MVASRQQRRPRGRAHRRHVKTVVAHPLVRDPVIVRGVDRPAKRTRIAEPGVVDQHDQHIRRSRRRLDVTDLLPARLRTAERLVRTPLKGGRRIGRWLRSMLFVAHASSPLLGSIAVHDSGRAAGTPPRRCSVRGHGRRTAALALRTQSSTPLSAAYGGLRRQHSAEPKPARPRTTRVHTCRSRPHRHPLREPPATPWRNLAVSRRAPRRTAGNDARQRRPGRVGTSWPAALSRGEARAGRGDARRRGAAASGVGVGEVLPLLGADVGDVCADAHGGSLVGRTRKGRLPTPRLREGGASRLQPLLGSLRG